jgi:plastocyanin
MRAFRIWGCLLLPATLLIIGGCEKAGFKAPLDVGISNCTASPDTVTVREGQQVRWQPTDHDYTIRFSNSGEPTANPFTVKHGASNPAHPIKGHSGCVSSGHGEFYCKYSLTQDNGSTPCADPGVHIVPGP